MSRELPHLLGDVVIYNDVADLVEELSERGDGGRSSSHVLYTATPQQPIQLPVGQSRAAWALQDETGRRLGLLYSQ